MIRESTTRKSANRRLAQNPANRKNQHLLDVKVRSRTARRQRNRKINGLVFAVLLITCIGFAGYYGTSHLLNRFFFQNSAYALQHLDVDLDGAMTKEDFLKKTGVHEGLNIFSINLAKVEADLCKDPRISSVHIERTLPDKLAIQVVQRHPVAWISTGSDVFSPENAYLVGMDGILMKPKTTAPEYLSLPVIKGMEVESLHEGETPNLPALLSALELIEKNNMAASTFLKIRTMDLSKKYCMEVLNDQNARITFGLADIDDQLGRLNTLLAHCRETNQQIESINLMVHRNTPVRFVMTEAAPPVKSVSPALHPASKATRIQ